MALRLDRFVFVLTIQGQHAKSLYEAFPATVYWMMLKKPFASGMPGQNVTKMTL